MISRSSGACVKENPDVRQATLSDQFCKFVVPNRRSMSDLKSINPQFRMAQISELRQVAAKLRVLVMYGSDAALRRVFAKIALKQFSA